MAMGVGGPGHQRGLSSFADYAGETLELLVPATQSGVCYYIPSPLSYWGMISNTLKGDFRRAHSDRVARVPLKVAAPESIRHPLRISILV